MLAMTVDLLYTVLSIGVISTGITAYLLPRSRAFSCMFAELDEDIKIAPDTFSPPHTAETDAADQAARDFLRQKELGNVDRARELGVRYAQVLFHTGEGLLAKELQGKEPSVQHQQYLLYSYVVNRIIYEYSPNSILAQTSLNQFYNDVEAVSEELYRHISDMAAFSLYILNERANPNADENIGTVFADLCGCAGDSALIDYGNSLFQQLYAFCAKEMQATEYKSCE